MNFRPRLTLVMVLALSLPWSSLQAAAPQVKTQGAGFYRLMLGDFEVTALSDGTIALPVGQFLGGITPAKVEKALTYSYLKEPVETSVNAYLINTGAKLVLVDTGCGALEGPTLGFLIANLKASGYEPEQVDEVYITHMHGDHIGGLMTGDKLTFPNATVRADKRDADFWLSQANMDAAPKEQKDSFKAPMAMLNPYIAAGKFKAFTGDTELIPGVRAIARPGHTPGHTVYMVESKGQRLILWGDLMHVAAIQFADPSVFIKFDTDSREATLQRKKAFAEAAKDGYLVGAAHLSFPGLGRLRSNGEGYSWLPLNYGLLH